MAAGQEPILLMDSAMEARHCIHTIPEVQLYGSLIKVAKYLELAYLAVSDQPDVANEVRHTAQSARIIHMMTTGLMRSLMVTSKHIVDTMIPMIFDAVNLQDKELVRDCFAQMITRAEEMKQDAVDIRQQYYKMQTNVQNNFAQLNTKNKIVKDRLDIEKVEDQKLADENERAAIELENEKEKMENDIKYLKARREKWMEETERANKDMKEEDDKTFFDDVIAPPYEAAGPAGIAIVIMKAGFNVISSSYGRKKKVDQFHNMMQAYQESHDTMDKVSAERREFLLKMQDRKREKMEHRSKIKQLTVEKANPGDAKCLQEASTNLGDVDRQFSRMITFWDKMVVTLKFIKDEEKDGEIYLKRLEDPNYAERFKASLTRAEDRWKVFGKIYSDYVFASENDANVATTVLYNFLSDSIEAVPAVERRMRMISIADEIEENIDFD